MKRHNPSPATIRDAVCAAFEIAPELMLSNLTEDRVVLPRKAYVYLLRTQGAFTPLEIMALVPYKRAAAFRSIDVAIRQRRMSEDFDTRMRAAELAIIQSK